MEARLPSPNLTPRDLLLCSLLPLVDICSPTRPKIYVTSSNSFFLSFELRVVSFSSLLPLSLLPSTPTNHSDESQDPRLGEREKSKELPRHLYPLFFLVARSLPCMASSSSKPPSSSSHPHAPIAPLLPLSTPIQHSSDVWSSDLRTLFEKAKERFGDVSWEVGREGDEDGEDDEDDDFESVDGREHGQKERIWGHKGELNILLGWLSAEVRGPVGSGRRERGLFASIQVTAESGERRASSCSWETSIELVRSRGSRCSVNGVYRPFL